MSVRAPVKVEPIPFASAEEVASLRAEVAALRAELRALRETREPGWRSALARLQTVCESMSEDERQWLVESEAEARTLMGRGATDG